MQSNIRKNHFENNLPMPATAKSSLRGMLATLATLILIMALAQNRAGAASVDLSWIASTATNVVSYNVYYGTKSGEYTSKLTVGDQTTAAIANLTPGVTYYFSATANDVSGTESDFSTETSYSVPAVVTPPTQPVQPVQPTLATLAIKPVMTGGVVTEVTITSSGPVPASWSIEVSTDMVHWGAVVSGTTPAVNVSFLTGNTPSEFFRLVKN
jgi:hypothetical protein